MNIGVIGRCGGDVLRPALTAFACPAVQEIAIAALASASFPAANHREIKAEPRERTGTRKRTGPPTPACVPALSARYQFSCPFTGWHPEIRGADRSGRERASRAAIPCNITTVSPGTSGRYGWLPAALLPGMAAWADSSAGSTEPQLLYQAIGTATCGRTCRVSISYLMPAPAGGRRLISPNVLPVLKHRLGWPRAIRSLLGGMAAVALMLAIAWLLFVPAADWLAHHDVGSAQGPRLQAARDAARGQLLALGAGLLAAGALVLTVRNLTLARRTFELTEQRQATGRYATAIEQLGSDKLDVRIGGIYALERIARDSANDHPTVMEVLTAFIREHSRDQGPPPPQGRKKMRPDLQSALTVAGRRDAQRDIQRLDLTMADLSSASLTGANLAGAQVAFADLSYAYLSNATLARGCLLGANLHGASIGGADFTGADLAGADLTFALAAAGLNGANFTGARLDGAKWPENAPAPRGWRLDTRSGRLKAAGTESGPAQADRRAISRPVAHPLPHDSPNLVADTGRTTDTQPAGRQMARTAHAAAARGRQGTARPHLAQGRDHVLSG